MASAHPIYCKQPGAELLPWCQGETMCSCQGYCKYSAPGSWGWDPNCCLCDGAERAPKAGGFRDAGASTDGTWPTAFGEASAAPPSGLGGSAANGNTLRGAALLR